MEILLGKPIGWRPGDLVAAIAATRAGDTIVVDSEPLAALVLAAAASVGLERTVVVREVQP